MGERQRDTWIFIAIAGVAFLVRWLYLREIRDLALFEHLAFDGARYDTWAHEIRAGAWVGRGVFFQAPLYPYFLALVETFTGHDPWAIRLVQSFGGALACGWVFTAGRELLSRNTGILAGGLMALYAPAIFFDGIVQKASLDVFLVAAFLAALARARRTAGRGVWILPGIVLGLLCLTRENALIWLPLIPAWIAWRDRSARRWIPRAGLFLTGVAVCLLPVAFRNLAVGGQFALTTSQFGANFYIGNNAAADGTYEPFQPGWGSPELEQEDIRRLAERAVGRPLEPAEVSDYWLHEALADIRADPLRWIRLLGTKWLLLWNGREIEDADDFYLYREHAWILRALSPVDPFGPLASLAAAGAVWTWRRRRELLLLHGLILSLAASVALFFVFARYRISLVPLLAPLAAAGILEGVHRARSRDWRGLGGGLGVLGLALVATHWPLLDRPRPSPAGLNNLGVAQIEANAPTAALQTFDRALRLHPESSELHYNRANLLRDLGRIEEAERELRTVVRLEPAFAEAWNNLGVLLGVQGRRDEAIAAFRQALEHEPELLDARRNLARALARSGRWAEAERELKRILRAHPDLEGVRGELAAVRKALEGSTARPLPNAGEDP